MVLGTAQDGVAAMGESHLQDSCVASICHRETRREVFAEAFNGGSTRVPLWFGSGCVDRLELVDRPV
jgi:hypothetical protein